MNDYTININKTDNVAHITKSYWNPSRKLKDMEERPFLFEVGMRIVDIFDNVVTIKEIIKRPPLQPGQCPQWLILVEESGNQYQVREIAGIYVKTVSMNELNAFIGNAEKHNG